MGDSRVWNLEHLSDAVHYRDLAVLYGLAVTLLAVHRFSPGVEYVGPTDPPVLRALALIASTFVHLTWTHVLTNVVGYVVLVTVLYVLCAYLEVLGYFRTMFVTILLGTPLAGNFLATVVYTVLYPSVRTFSVGFSGVVSALVGWLFVVLLLYFSTVFRTQTVLFIGWLYTFLTLEVLIWVHDALPVLRWLVAVGVGISGLGVLLRASENPQIGWYPSYGPQAEQAIAMLIAGGCLWVAFLVGIFPSQGGAGAPQIDLVGHSIGLFIGIGLATNWALYFELLAADLHPVPIQGK